MNLKLRNIPFSPPDIGEEEIQAVNEVLHSGWITTGPKTKEFERKIADYCNTSKAVCLNSATACLETALRLLGIGNDDEIIVPAYTYTATASVTQHVGAKLIFTDSQADCVEMDYDKLEQAITEHTKVIIPVDLAGIMADYDRIFSIIERKRHLFKPSNEIQEAIGRIVVLADGAHSFGASQNGFMSGSKADFTSFSFHAVKNLTTAEGGALVWNLPFGGDTVLGEGLSWDESLYKQAQLYSLHGQNKDALAKTRAGAWEYDIIGPWYKCNMTDIMAAIGLVQLKRYPSLLSRRRQIIEKYDDAFKGCGVETLKHYSAAHSGSGHLYLARLTGKDSEYRNSVIEKMAGRGIATNVHYKPLPMMTAYRNLGFDIKDFPNAYKLFKNEITLPLHSRLSDEDVDYIIKNFTEIITA